jgi:hypothetical protein
VALGCLLKSMNSSFMQTCEHTTMSGRVAWV